MSSSYGRLWLRPRELADQQCLQHELTVDPGAEDLSTGRDVYGNDVAYFHVSTPHTHLEVTGTSLVRVLHPEPDPAATALAWEDARPAGVHGRAVLDLVLDQRDPASGRVPSNELRESSLGSAGSFRRTPVQSSSSGRSRRPTG